MSPALLVSLLLSTSVPASQQRQAVEYFHRSMTEYELGNFDAALDAIAKAYRLDPRPALLFNLGQCHRALHHWERAAFFYNEYLAKTPRAANATLVTQLILEMKDRLRASRAAASGPPDDVPLFASPPAGPAPRPAPYVLVPAPSPAPAEAVSASPAPASHSHWLGATFLGAAVVCVGFAAYGVVRVVEYQQIPTQTTNWTQYGQAVALNYQNTQNWGTAAIALGVAAAGGVTGAVLTW